jgi:hypothetical protein
MSDVNFPIKSTASFAHATNVDRYQYQCYGLPELCNYSRKKGGFANILVPQKQNFYRQRIHRNLLFRTD